MDIDNRRYDNVEPVLLAIDPQCVDCSLGLESEAEIRAHRNYGGVEPIDDIALYELLR